MSTGFGIASPALAATPLPEGYEESAVYLRAFLLNCQDAVKANEVRRRQMLRAAVESVLLAALVDVVPQVADLMMCEIPDDFEADTPDGDLPLDLPGPSSD